jgi:hypothetical protein
MWIRFLTGALLVLSSGCASTQLKLTTINVVNTLADMQYRQVLDNLARFTSNPGSLPDYAVIGQGTSQVNDQAALSDTLTWVHKAFPLNVFGIGPASRSVSVQWTLAAVTDPDKLKQLRCIFQQASGREYPDCYDCDQELADANLRFNDHCPFPPNWFNVGTKWQVPHDACYVGHCGHTYVWVMPEGVDALTRLTLAVQDIATFQPSGPQEIDLTIKGAKVAVEPGARAEAAPLAPRARARPARKEYYYPLPNLMFTPQSR